MENPCLYCNVSQRGRCQSQEEADKCSDYIEKQNLLKPTPRHREESQISFTVHLPRGKVRIESHYQEDPNLILITRMQNAEQIIVQLDEVDVMFDTLKKTLNHVKGN